MARMLAASEEYDGRFLPYSLRPYNVIVQTEVPRWKSMEPESTCRVKVDTDWKIDTKAWEHYKERFKDKYPKAMQVLTAEIER
jgi:hypothetical protein